MKNIFNLKNPTYYVVTFGCQMNAHDSEKIAGMLSEMGFIEAPDELSAGIIVFNTCTVREKANNHLYGRLGRLKQIKKDNPELIVSITGCMMQEKDEVSLILKRYPFVDIILGTYNLHTFPMLLTKLLLEHSRPLVSVWEREGDMVEDLPLKRKFFFKQGVNIMYGCNNFCTYCIVPYVRGRERSRKPGDIYSEIIKAAREGVKEIMLLGQNVNSYSGGISFAKLLSEVDKIAVNEGIERIRFMTSHPKDLNDELIFAIANAERVTHQFHLPLQSGSDRVLKAMNRGYSADHFLERAKKLREAVPDISLSTDIIVGFPGESEQDFLDTLSLLRELCFDFAYTFIYSKRSGTPAASFKDEADPEIIKDRFSRLLSLQNRITSENLSGHVGETEYVLYESLSEHDKSLISGKTDSGASVHSVGDSSLIGKLKKTRLKECKGFYFMGEIID